MTLMGEVGMVIRYFVAAAVRASVDIDQEHMGRNWTSQGVQRWKREKLARQLERRKVRR